MNDKFDTVMQEIAVKHGVVLSKDDPILILQTMHDRLIEETRQAQAAMLTQFREEMEGISSQWKDDSNEKAEKALNAALAGSKEVMAKLLQESTNASVHAMKKMILDSLAEAQDLVQQARKFSQFTLLSSATILTASSLFILLLIHILN
ncbi:conjugal transfer protein TraM [Legionella bozemanae]|uniref:conjugal transfer protein TraM n=1 Tax=Legionella bozemanae TaxID=447 RepID=UPI00399D17FB